MIASFLALAIPSWIIAAAQHPNSVWQFSEDTWQEITSLASEKDHLGNCTKQLEYVTGRFEEKKSSLKAGESSAEPLAFSDLRSQIVIEASLVLACFTFWLTWILIANRNTTQRLRQTSQKGFVPLWIGIAAFVAAIHYSRFYISSFLLIEKEVVTWSSYCVLHGAAFWLTRASDAFPIIAISAPLAFIWYTCSTQMVPALRLDHADGHCGIRPHIVYLQRTSYILTALAALLAALWAIYLQRFENPDPIYAVQPFAYAGIFAALYWRLFRHVAYIKKSYNAAVLKRLRQDFKEPPRYKKSSLQKVTFDQMQESKIAPDPTRNLVDENGIAYVKAYALVGLTPAITLAFKLLGLTP